MQCWLHGGFNVNNPNLTVSATSTIQDNVIYVLLGLNIKIFEYRQKFNKKGNRFILNIRDPYQ